ncbi:MAG: hypothetical protein KDB14_10770 [Planctomycetales bacterium]|nr:hypothetical protein [Planctomycetales bacterium]
MSMRLTALSLALAALHMPAAACGQESSERTWTATTGDKLTARFIEVVEGRVRLQRPGGETVRIALEALAPADRQLATKLARVGAVPSLANAPVAPERWEVPALTDVPANRQLSPFYRQYMEFNGVPIVAAEEVNPKAMEAAHFWLQTMMAKRPDLVRELAVAKVRVAVLGVKQSLSQIPEYQDNPRAKATNLRCLSADTGRPVVTAPEENLLGAENDPSRAEQLFVHEFAHTLHQVALARVEPKFDADLLATYRNAMREGRWQRTNAATNHAEYFA